MGILVGQGKASEALDAARALDALEWPFAPGTARGAKLTGVLAQAEARAMNGLPVDQRYLLDVVLPELTKADGHANCQSVISVQRIRRILSYVGRDAEADALLDAYLPKAKAELAEPGVQWRDSKAACIAELEEGT